MPIMAEGGFVRGVELDRAKEYHTEIKEMTVVLDEEIGHVRLITLNNPSKLNIITPEVVKRLAELYEKWEKANDVEIIVIKGAGRAFCAGGDLRMFYYGKAEKHVIEAVYKMYWLEYHIHTYKKALVAIVHATAMGGGASLTVPSTFTVVTEKTVLAAPEAGLGFHTDASLSYILSRLPGHLGEYLALTGARVDGAEMVAIGLGTHYLPSEKLPELEKRLINLKSGDKSIIRAAIEELSIEVQPGEKSVLFNRSLIDKCFSKDTVEGIIDSLITESNIEGNEWVERTIKTLKRSSPTGLKMTLKSVRQARNQTLSECLKKEFRLTLNTLRGVISNDMYEGIRAQNIDKDFSPKWNPPSLREITEEKLDLVFQPFEEKFELQILQDEKIP
ncbi:hypothetical protein KI387_028053, partial [Taxus chinensis]